jgi:hypothetical protein
MEELLKLKKWLEAGRKSFRYKKHAIFKLYGPKSHFEFNNFQLLQLMKSQIGTNFYSRDIKLVFRPINQTRNYRFFINHLTLPILFLDLMKFFNEKEVKFLLLNHHPSKRYTAVGNAMVDHLITDLFIYEGNYLVFIYVKTTGKNEWRVIEKDFYFNKKERIKLMVELFSPNHKHYRITLPEDRRYKPKSLQENLIFQRIPQIRN